VLATTDPQKVPVTVLSRCLQFNLRPMAPETIRDHLRVVLQAENVSVDLPSLALLARFARGSMRDALSLADQAISFGAGQIEETTVRLMLGSVDRSYVFRLLDALARGDGKTVVETSEALRLNGLNAASTLEEMSTILQRMAILQIMPAGEQAHDLDPDLAEIARLAVLLPADETQLLYSICLHGRAELGLAPDEYAALTMVLLRLLAFKPQSAGSAAHQILAEKKTLIDVPGLLAAPPERQILAVNMAVAPVNHASPAIKNESKVVPFAPPGIKNGAKVVPVAPPGQQLQVLRHPDQMTPQLLQKKITNEAPEHAEQAHAATNIIAIEVRVQADSRSEAAGAQGAGVLVLTPDGDFWQRTVQQLIDAESISALARELALQSQLVARDTDQWQLRVERESLNQAGSRDRLVSALAASGYPVSLVVEVGRVTDSPARRNAAQAAQRMLTAEKIIFDDPFVQAMMRDFGAKIVPGSIRPG
jgi:DNA polymerase-3 subunit gamma/tau